jgi:uncharacterized protein YndB with AHSA1/START domain/ribosomal protein S18 acetylase RimI-like enzyme
MKAAADMASTFVHRWIRAPRDRVYRALIDAEAIARWKVPDGMRAHVHRFEGRQGGTFRISLTYDGPTNAGKTTERTDTYHGRFVTLVPNERVVEAYEFETAKADLRGEMVTTITLADSLGGTDLVAVHEGLPRGLSPADNETGWRMALDKLATLVEASPSKADSTRLRVRRAAVQDIDAVHSCLAAAFAPYQRRYTPQAFRDTVPDPDDLATRFRTMRVLVAEDDGDRIVGTLAHEVGASGQGHLRGMAVLPAALGSGAAPKLLETAERELAAAGCRRITLDTTEPLERAIRFYERHGYTATGRVSDFFGMRLLEYAKIIK